MKIKLGQFVLDFIQMLGNVIYTHLTTLGKTVLAGIPIAFSFYFVLVILAAYGQNDMIFKFSLFGAGLVNFLAWKFLLPDADEGEILTGIVSVGIIAAIETTMQAFGTSALYFVDGLSYVIGIGVLLGMGFFYLPIKITIIIGETIGKFFTPSEPEQEKRKNDRKNASIDRLNSWFDDESESTDSNASDDSLSRWHSESITRYRQSEQHN